MIEILLSIFGWREHTFDGTKAWVHVSGVVVYNQNTKESK